MKSLIAGLLLLSACGSSVEVRWIDPDISEHSEVDGSCSLAHDVSEIDISSDVSQVDISSDVTLDK